MLKLLVYRALLLFLPLFLLGGCSLPKAPGRLEWDVKLTAPFGVETYRLLDLVDTDSTIDEQGWGIGLGEDSVLFFTAHGQADANLEDSLRLDPFNYTITDVIDAILLPVETSQEWSPNLYTLNPEIAGHHGQIYSFPFPISDTRTIQMPAGVDSFRVDTGHVWVHIRNSLQVIRDIQIRLNDRQGEEVLIYSGNDTLYLGETLDLVIPLNGVAFSAVNDLVISATAGGGDIVINANDGITWSAEWHTLQCEPYYGIVYPQTLQKDSTFLLDQRHRLFQGTVKRGTMELVAINGTQFDDSISIKFLDVVGPDGDTLLLQYFVPAGQDTQLLLDLTDYRLRLYNEFPQRIRAQMRSVSVQTGDRREFIEHFEIVSGYFEVRDLVLSYFEGELSNLQTEIPFEEIEVDRPPKGWDAVHPTTVDIALRVESSVALYADVTIYLSSYLGAQRIDTVNIFLRDVYFGADSTLWIRDVAGLVAEYPDRFTYEGNAVVNGIIASSDTSRIRATIELLAPLRFRMDTVQAPGDVQRVDVEPIEDIESAVALVKVWNRLPVGGQTIVLVSPDSMALLPGSGIPVDTVTVAAIPVPPIVEGRATSAVLTEFNVTLDQSIITLLQHPPFFARVSLLLPGAGDQEFIAHASDFVQTQVVGEITYRLNSEDGP